MEVLERFGFKIPLSHSHSPDFEVITFLTKQKTLQLLHISCIRWVCLTQHRIEGIFKLRKTNQYIFFPRENTVVFDKGNAK